MYQAFFGFNSEPFALTPNTALFYALPPHYEAINTVLSSIDMGEGIIKVTGEVGTGKTMVCRMLINQLAEQVRLVYIPNPLQSGESLRRAIAHELGVESADSNQLIEQIHAKLLEICRQGKQVVAIIDEAQALSDEALEVLRLFGNLETEQRKLLHIVLLGQPELDTRLEAEHLRQFRQRITFNATLRTLTISEGCAYIQHRIESSGSNLPLFTLAQKKSIWKASRGIPRLINQICHKALILAFSMQQKTIQNKHIYEAVQDTYDARKPKYKTLYLWERESS